MSKNSSYISLYKEAIHRILNDIPVRVPVGVKITQKTVTAEIGFSEGVTSTLRRSYPEIIELIDNAQNQQIQTDNAYTRQTLAPFYEALDRLINNKPLILPKNSKINPKNVALEAGRAEGAIRQDRPNYIPIIDAIKKAPKGDNRTLQQRKLDLEKALERLKNGTPIRVSPTCKITAKSVSEEAGLNGRYICFNRVDLKDLISEIEATKKTAS